MNKRFNAILKSGVVLAAAVLSVTAARAEGLYIGGNVGMPDYHSSFQGINGNGNTPGYKLYGGYQLTPYLGVELGGFDLGHIDNASGKVKTQGGYVDATGTYPLASQWSLLGSLGLTQARFTTSAGDDSGAGVKLGAGVQYDLNKQLALRMQYDRYHFNNAFDGTANVGQVSFGVKLGF